jgi:hypothetical protein
MVCPIEHARSSTQKSVQWSLVDNTFTTGSTLTALIDYRDAQDIATDYVFTAASGRYGKELAAPAERQAAALENGDMTAEVFRSVFGIEISRFTGAELRAYLINGGSGRSGFADRFFAGTVPEVGSLLRGNDSQGSRGAASDGELIGSDKPGSAASFSL